MNKKRLITLIIVLLLLNAGLLTWAMQKQSDNIQRHNAEAAVAAGKELSAAVSVIPQTARAAQEDAVKELAASHVYAHRGVSGESLEHSFRAYDQAIADGARYIEQDIVISKEGTLYVSHDLSAARMTGVSRLFSAMTDGEIDALTTHAGEKVLRLSEVFDRYGDSIDYVIELKSSDRPTIDGFIRLVDQYGFEDRIIVQCFYLDTLRALEEVYPDMPKLYLCEFPAYLNQGYEAEYVDIISVELSMMTEDNLRRAHRLGKQFSAWPMVSEDQIRRAIDLGVDSYFTDDVPLAISLEEDYGIRTRSQ